VRQLQPDRDVAYIGLLRSRRTSAERARPDDRGMFRIAAVIRFIGYG
jgi:hypothetical protein